MGIQFQEVFGWVRRRKVFATLLIAFTLGVGILIGSLISGRALATHDQAATGATLLAVPDPVILSNAFSGISKKIGPAVVNISTTQIIDKPKGSNKKPKSFTDPFEDFYNK
jgi:S1-C subfamily serine protease